MIADPRRLKLLVASALPAEVNDDLVAHFDVTFAAGLDPATTIQRLGTPFDALLVSVDVPLRAEQLRWLSPSVRAIATYSVGLDHIDLEVAGEIGLAVFNTPDVLGDAVAETAMLLMLGAARRATESISLIRSRRWMGWTATQLIGVELAGRRLGMFGMGKIGRKIARRAKAFDMSVSYSNRHRLDDELADGARFQPDLAHLMRDIDVLVLAAPSTAATRGIIDDKMIAEAKPGLILVNIARGELVVDDALIAALKSGHVRAAGLDVFAGEPAIHPGYADLPNVFMLPHIGSSTVEARRRMGVVLIAALREWRQGHSPPNRVI
jgi:lactate dehydrogenase-like 2-hydroxyacid dehydrogenase